MRGPPGRSERGAATVVAVALLGLLVLLGCALSVVAAIFTAHRTAQAAADLAALAGATSVAAPGSVGGDPCGVAGEVAQANGARLTQCTVDGRTVTVRVAVPGPRWRGWAAGDLGAESRAGPVGG